MDASKYMMAIFWYNLSLIFIFNTVLLILFRNYINYSLIDILLLLMSTIVTRIIGEAFNIWFYKNINIYGIIILCCIFSILILLLLVSFLPFFNIFISRNLMIILLVSFYTFNNWIYLLV